MDDLNYLAIDCRRVLDTLPPAELHGVHPAVGDDLVDSSSG